MHVARSSLVAGDVRSLLIISALLLLVAGAAACSDDGGGAAANNGAANNGAANNATNNGHHPNNGANNGNNGTPTTCSSDAQCGADELCDTAEGLCRSTCSTDDGCIAAQQCGPDGYCVSRPACAASTDCGGGEVCNTCSGRCERTPVAGALSCSTDMNCLFEEFCDPCRKVCRPLGQVCDSCVEDVECGGGRDFCLDFAGGGRFCGNACTVEGDCPRGYLCADVADGRQCVPRSGDCAHPGECDSDDDCAAGMMCGPQLSCVAGCTEGTCPNGEVCDRGACKPPCGSDADCTAPAVCEAGGLCKVPGGCLTSRDCEEPGTYCNLEALMCEPGCGEDDDCAGLEICRANRCQPRPCDGNYLCAFGQVCNTTSGQCERAEGPYCDACDAEAEDQCGGDPNMCLRISDEDGNAIGDYCGVGCEPDNLDACPVGYGCEEIMDENMQAVGAVCFRACHRDPI